MTFIEWFAENKKKLYDWLNEVEHFEPLFRGVWQAAQPKWQPIETAPKDGTRVLLLGRDKRHADGHWEAKAYNGNGCWVWPYGKSEPQKWMPLPNPPEEQ